MKKILIVQAIILLFLLLLSLATGTLSLAVGILWIPVIILLSVIIGPYMAYYYPWGFETHLGITIGFIIASILMFYGIKYRDINKGIFMFTLGFWLWASIGLFFGLSTGT